METTQIHTQYGELQGIREHGAVIWKGVPFAEPPVGELRFQAPRPPQPWQGVKEALHFGPIAPQPVYEGASMFGSGSEPPVQSEDCLYLNIWASDKSTQKRPVMVWIHGGSFVTGAGSIPLYDGTSLAVNGDMIVITINYRLGPFGFLNLSSYGDDYHANVGLLDQIAALEWIKNNIEAFGGDPERVTVFGESAGAMSIASLLAMPAAKGLFQGAIMQSGASQAMPAETSRQIADGFVQALGVGEQDLSKLYTASTEEILQAGNRVSETLANDTWALLFQPTIHPHTLPVEPVQAIKDGSAKHIPLIIGTNLEEGTLFFNQPTQLMNEAQIVKIVQAVLGEDTHGVSKQYPLTVRGHADLMTDLFFWRAALQYAEAQIGHAPVWMYRFDWCQPGHPLLGTATHGAEIAFAFNNLPLFAHLGLEIDEDTYNLAEQMQTAWINFAHNSMPVTSNLPWSDYDLKDRSTMLFNRELNVVHDPESEKRQQLISYS